MESSTQFKKYSRKEVHDLLSPDTTFTPQAGTWGLQGIVKVPKTKADYAFFVTYGQSQGTHKFEEGIDANGILSWQSQPRMNLQSKEIQDFISHDPSKSNIYLFLRTSKKDLYTYLGNLEYVNHDNQKERPVFFKWKILNWNSEQALSALDDFILNPVRNESGLTYVDTKDLYLPMNEGAAYEQIVSRYERDPRNRKLAIDIHGQTCFVCGFNFGDKYGSLGKDYIEIHHLDPLSMSDGEKMVNPKTDLIPLCANCHRMVHRSTKEVLSVEQLKEAMKKPTQSDN